MKIRTIFWGGLPAIFFISGCGPNQSILDSANRNNKPAVNMSIEMSSVEQDLEAMRTAQFAVVFVIRRKDAGVFDPEDRRVVRDNTSQANRRVAAEEGKAIIVGSNFSIQPQNMKLLQERFVIEDHSPPAMAANADSAN